MIEPSTNAAVPLAAKKPMPGARASAAKSAMAMTIRRTPAQLMGRLPKAANARIRQMTPITPGKMLPGLYNSAISPMLPSVNRM